MNTAVTVEDLHKRYGEVRAVDGISFTIERGEIFGLLGPNGAGKTTTVEMIEGLRNPDSGSIHVCGMDVTESLQRVKEVLGVQLQSTTIENKIRVGEVVELFGGYYEKRLPKDEVLETVGLVDREKSFVESLSGGQKKRLAVALALVNDPEVLILDEPTTGLDPQARRNLWSIMEAMKSARKTIILTTHYIEEAERFCDRVAVIDHGKIIASGAPSELIQRQKMDSAVEFTSSGRVERGVLEQFPGVSEVIEEEDRFILYTKDSHAALIALVELSRERGFSLDNISVRKATLEDVFLELTGRKIRE